MLAASFLHARARGVFIMTRAVAGLCFEEYKKLTDKCCLVSTIIATYNRPRFVVKALDNLFRQSHRPIEVLVIDDGSGPATADAVSRWRARHGVGPDFRLEYHWQHNRGPATARNSGIRVSSGELVHFLDDDDFLHEHALAHLVVAVDPGKAAVAMASYQHFSNGIAAGTAQMQAPATRRQRLQLMIAGQWFVPVHGYLFTRRALQRIGDWNAVLTSQEDDEFVLRGSMAGVSFSAVPAARVYYYHHDGARRSVPGKPGETVEQGQLHRMQDDLAIRESAFAKLRKHGSMESYRTDFGLWHKRFKKRYGHLPATHRCPSRLLDWLDAQQGANRDASRYPLPASSAVPDRPGRDSWRLA